MNQQPPTKVVKVKAFPIKAKMTIGTDSVEGQILKLTQTGFLIDAPAPGLKTGAKFQISFNIPLTGSEVSANCVLVKLYTSVGSHVVEGHFQTLSAESEERILKFLHNIPKTARPADQK